MRSGAQRDVLVTAGSAARLPKRPATPPWKAAPQRIAALIAGFLLSAAAGEADLALTIQVTAVEGQRLPALTATIANRGSTPALLVKPGDGSEAAWREPVVRLSGERLDGEIWVPVQPQGALRCGNYDADWRKDVVEVAAGTVQPLGSWLPSLHLLRLDRAGRYRVRLHYAWTGGAAGKGRPSLTALETGVPDPPRPEPDLGRMAGIAPFELVSPAVEFDLPAPPPIPQTP